MKELVIVAKDRVGLLADISDALAAKKVNIDGVSADIVGVNAVIRLLVKDHKKGSEALKKAGFTPIAGDTLVIALENRPGELSKVARILSDHGTSVLNVYMLGKEDGKGLFAIKVDNMAKARKLLAEYL